MLGKFNEMNFSYYENIEAAEFTSHRFRELVKSTSKPKKLSEETKRKISESIKLKWTEPGYVRLRQFAGA